MRELCIYTKHFLIKYGTDEAMYQPLPFCTIKPLNKILWRAFCTTTQDAFVPDCRMRSVV